ncbi:MAG: hypothetical protein GW762_05835 [Candidatus Pacebacteria bacterium]|nr:hypothetical protein [Candidatus Paceibacterota bacterium]PIR63220.1 MAG: hypothetical protein COU64_05890 [Candidatus Pacebacteria bacterium CG10_big_fil_rev_8_21_14_0_10_40_26]PIZ78250.1 MAG: hypothetical protein COY01_05710 [Candidatus Pacebacteria bacterium CG_4_10_14_0_2_um_filter_40_20]PJA68705.1 MAG: hypothetical protein CO156_04335 [Candidatus Pacebacteria bacterium CG_4_9_14_3_um_filter_40_12]PJC41645.1 MAG: hypothetical protein CO041_02925 [Candidatus Pacebacteria bacterium CG_4_9_
MGTSNPNGGSSGSNPLIPSWLVDPAGTSTENSDTAETVDNPNEDSQTGSEEQSIPTVVVDHQRYSPARSNFTRFTKSGGRDTNSLRRAVSSYVRRSSGGAKNATTKMGSSRKTASKLLGFLQEASNNGIESALKSLNLESLSGNSMNELFIELTDFLCSEAGTVDAGIARDAFIKTIADVNEEQVIDDGTLSYEQVQTIFELYITHTIEDMILNEIGTNIIFQTQTLDDADLVQAQLHDFIRNGVSDALSNSGNKINQLNQNEIGSFVDNIYESTFNLLSALYEEGGVG